FAAALAGDHAALLRKVEADGLAGYGACAIGPLPDFDPGAALAGDRDHRFVAAPDWGGQVFQTGPLARRWTETAALRERFGSGLLAHLQARLDELETLVPAMRRLAQGLEHDGGVLVPEGGGTGLGVVEAARGRLYHRIEIERGRIARYQILAPTEWNFHPRGPLAEGLKGADPGPARLLVAALDPCVACEVATHA
ncbi:MAG: nickel-dependent hydrogenase large subunit, partial [Magnetospirillum sp. WYHS-4]